MNVPELPPAAFLRVDMFPALVRSEALPGGRLDRVRLNVTDAHVHIFGLTRAGDIELVFTADLFAVEKAPEVGIRGVRVATADGTLIEAVKSQNCGCGMGRLKGAKLYPVTPPLQAL